MTLRFGFGFQIICFKSDKGLSPDRHETHDVLKILSAPKALHGGGDIHLQHPCDLAQQVWLSQQVRTGAWYRELGRNLVARIFSLQGCVVCLSLNVDGCVPRYVSGFPSKGKGQVEESC